MLPAWVKQLAAHVHLAPMPAPQVLPPARHVQQVSTRDPLAVQSVQCVVQGNTHWLISLLAPAVHQATTLLVQVRTVHVLHVPLADTRAAMLYLQHARHARQAMCALLPV